MTTEPDESRLIFSDSELHCLDCGTKHPYSKCPHLKNMAQLPDHDWLEEIKRTAGRMHWRGIDDAGRVVDFTQDLRRLIAEVERLRQENSELQRKWDDLQEELQSADRQHD